MCMLHSCRGYTRGLSSGLGFGSRRGFGVGLRVGVGVEGSGLRVVLAERRAARLGEWRLALALESPHTPLGVDADVRREHDE